MARRPVPDLVPRVLSAAQARFRKYGYQKTSIQEIAGDAQVGVGTLYNYFKDKDAILLACVDAFRHVHRETVERIVAEPGPASEKLRRYVRARFRVARDTRENSPHAAEIERAVIRLRPDRVQEEGAWMIEAIRKILEEGIRNDALSIPDLEEDIFVFLHAIAGFFPSAADQLGRNPEETSVMRVVDWFLRKWSLAGEPASKGPRRRGPR